jgi:hypothetical protein
MEVLVLHLELLLLLAAVAAPVEQVHLTPTIVQAAPADLDYHILFLEHQLLTLAVEVVVVDMFLPQILAALEDLVVAALVEVFHLQLVVLEPLEQLILVVAAVEVLV